MLRGAKEYNSFIKELRGIEKVWNRKEEQRDEGKKWVRCERAMKASHNSIGEKALRGEEVEISYINESEVKRRNEGGRKGK